MTDPKSVRYASGSDPVPESEQIPEFPSDSADWMSREPQGYADGALFDSDDEEDVPLGGDEEATDG